MYKFTAGDKVRFINDKGVAEYEVLHPFKNDSGTTGCLAKILKGFLAGSHTILWHDTNFELVRPEPKFKVGDVVWFTVDLGTILIGEVTSIVELSDSVMYNIKADQQDFRYSRAERELTKHNGPVIEVGDYVYVGENSFASGMHGRVTGLSQSIGLVYAHLNGTNVRAKDCQVMKAPPKFKVGDKVTWIDVKPEPITIDKVKPALSDPGGWAYNEDSVLEWALKPYIEHKFKVGDMVKNVLELRYKVVKLNDDGTIDVHYEGVPHNVYRNQKESIFTLVETPKPEPKPEFKVGDVVRLKSGGPRMTATRNNGELGWFCQWIDDSGHRGGTFLPATIEKVY